MRNRTFTATDFDHRHFAFERRSGIPHGTFTNRSIGRDVARAIYYGIAIICLIALVIAASNGSLV